MFEKHKLKKYSNYIIGFAYERSFCDIKTYLVIKNYRYNDIKFISYRNIDLRTIDLANEYIEVLEKQGYKNLNYFVEENVKRLVLENPIDMNSERPNRC